ncbi:MAG: rnhA operon protein [Natronomonas sp.]
MVDFDPATPDDTEGADSEGTDQPLPNPVLERVERLTHSARNADDDRAADHRAERERLLAAHGYTARIRNEDTRDVLVCHPEEWLEDGLVRPERIDDTDRAVEIPLSGPGDAEWDEIESHNRGIADAIEAEHGPVHGANAHAFADFAGNHYLKPMETTTDAEREEFRREYFPRNAWPSEKQRRLLSRTLELIDDYSSSSDSSWSS